MIFLYYTKKEVKSQSLIEKILFQKSGFSPERLKKNEWGKPFLEGNPVYFNATNTKGFSALAVSDCEIGIDAESLFREPTETLKAFVAKESYVKRIGGSIFRKFRALTFTDGVLFDAGKAVDRPKLFTIDEFLISVSCEDTEIQTINIDKENE